ncbi:MAG: PAS domain-containing protein, partial [Candidatus Zixiibacteriota bacterium]
MDAESDNLETAVVDPFKRDTDEISRFTESYAAFNRVINTLQRQYLELKEEYARLNESLAATNRRLQIATQENLAVNKMLHNILQSLAAGVIAIDQNGRITHFNRAASVLLGIPSGEPVGKLYRDIIPAGKPPDANALRTAESGRELEAVDRVIDLIDGTRLRLSVSTRILRDDAGKASGAVEILHDVTKIKRLEQELARLDTLAALGEMAATIAHQVRNPLAGIGGFASLLQRDIPTDDPRQKTVRKIVTGVERLNNTISALLNYTRSDELNCEEVDYHRFLQQNCALY